MSIAANALILTLLVLSLTAHAVDTVVVQTPYGPIRGFKNEKGSYSFLGVPFAPQMNRSTMFLPPGELQPWTETLDALEFQPGCMAKCRGKFAALMCPTKTSSTNCLYTDWYVPANALSALTKVFQNASTPLPILVFVHGGMSLWGSPSIPLYKGDDWVNKAHMILVGVGYRLNVWGSLATNQIPGNNAIRDMRSALKFVYTVASSFGGDPSRITVSGQSAGAAMTVIAYASVPTMWPYMAAALPISAPTGLTLPTKAMALELGDMIMMKLGCSTLLTTQADQLACLGNKTDDEILNTEDTLIIPTPGAVLSAIMSYQPWVDGDVIVDQPVARIANGNYLKKPIYLSDTSAEAIIFLDTAYFPIDETLIKIALEYVFDFSGEGKAIADLYGNVPESYWEKDGLEGGDEWAARILTDYIFVCSNDWIAATVQKDGVPAWRSTFQHVGSWTPFYFGPPKADWGCNKQPDGSFQNCCAQLGTHEVCHALDLVAIFDTTYLLPKEMNFPNRTADEVALSQFLQVDVFGSFVQNHTVPWPQFDNTTRPAYNLSIPTKGVVNMYRGEYCRAFDLYGYNHN